MVPMVAQTVVDGNVRSHNTFYGSTRNAIRPIWHVHNVSPNSCTMDKYTVLRATLQHVCNTDHSNAEHDLSIAICTITLPNWHGDPSNPEGTRKTNARGSSSSAPAAIGPDQEEA